MAAEDSIRIASTEPGVELELAWGDERTVHVTIRDKGLLAEADVWWNDYMEEPDSLVMLFEDLAASWKGWTDTKEWRSAESPLLLSCAHDGLGHIGIDVELRSGWYENAWRVRARIMLDAGALDQVASDLRAFLVSGS